MNQALIGFLAGLAAFWTIVYILGRVRRGPLEVYPGILIVRSGLRLEPMKPGARQKATIIFGYLSFVALVVSAGIFYYYVFTLFYIKYFQHQAGVQGFSPLIPGVTLSFQATLYILFAIGVAAFFHETAHALVARALGLKIKDAGIALFLFIPAAFVEIDEDDLKKARLRDKTLVYSAGVGANIILAIVFTFLFAHAATAYAAGVQIVEVVNHSVAMQAGLREGDIIVAVNGTPIKTVKDLKNTLLSLGAHNETQNVTLVLTVIRGGEKLNITLHKPSGTAMLGIFIKQYYPSSLASVIVTSLYSLYIINWSLALVNAAPLVLPLPGGVVYADGAQIVRDAIAAKFGEKTGVAVSLAIGVFTLILMVSLMSLAKLPLP